MNKKNLYLALFSVISVAVLLVAGCAGDLMDGATPSSESPLATSSTPEQTTPVEAGLSLDEALSNGKPTIAEFGSNCWSCEVMREILSEIAVAYEDKVNIVFIDVYEERGLVQQYGITTVPAQVVFDAEGNGIATHFGALAREDIVAIIQDMGVK